jgi:hypothetical protein
MVVEGEGGWGWGQQREPDFNALGGGRRMPACDASEGLVTLRYKAGECPLKLLQGASSGEVKWGGERGGGGGYRIWTRQGVRERVPVGSRMGRCSGWWHSAVGSQKPGMRYRSGSCNPQTKGKNWTQCKMFASCSFENLWLSQRRHAQYIILYIIYIYYTYIIHYIHTLYIIYYIHILYLYYIIHYIHTLYIIYYILYIILYIYYIQMAVLKSGIPRIQTNPSLLGLVLYQERILVVWQRVRRRIDPSLQASSD